MPGTLRRCQALIVDFEQANQCSRAAPSRRSRRACLLKRRRPDHCIRRLLHRPSARRHAKHLDVFGNQHGAGEDGNCHAAPHLIAAIVKPALVDNSRVRVFDIAGRTLEGRAREALRLIRADFIISIVPRPWCNAGAHATACAVLGRAPASVDSVTKATVPTTIAAAGETAFWNATKFMIASARSSWMIRFNEGAAHVSKHSILCFGFD